MSMRLFIPEESWECPKCASKERRVEFDGHPTGEQLLITCVPCGFEVETRCNDYVGENQPPVDTMGSK